MCFCVHRDFLSEGSSLSVHTVMQAPHLGLKGNKQLTDWLHCGAVLKSNRVGFSPWDSNEPLMAALSSFRKAQPPETAKSRHILFIIQRLAQRLTQTTGEPSGIPWLQVILTHTQTASHGYQRNLFETQLNSHSAQNLCEISIAN